MCACVCVGIGRYGGARPGERARNPVAPLAGPINTRHKLISWRNRPKNAPAHAPSAASRDGDAEYRNGDRDPILPGPEIAGHALLRIKAAGTSRAGTREASPALRGAARARLYKAAGRPASAHS